MKKNVFVMAMVAVFALIFVGCGDSKDSNESKTISAESNATKSPESNNLSANQSVDSKDSNADSKDSAQVSHQTTANLPANPAKNPQDLYKKCIACHGARGDKVAPGSAGSILIADLSKQILIDDLKGYRAKTLSRGGTAAIMYLQANGLSDEDIEILGEYISSFKK